MGFRAVRDFALFGISRRLALCAGDAGLIAPWLEAAPKSLLQIRFSPSGAVVASRTRRLLNARLTHLDHRALPRIVRAPRVDAWTAVPSVRPLGCSTPNPVGNPNSSRVIAAPNRAR